MVENLRCQWFQSQPDLMGLLHPVGFVYGLVWSVHQSSMDPMTLGPVADSKLARGSAPARPCAVLY